jgi:acetylornithine deacetylase
MSIVVDRDYLNATLSDLVRINSINPSLVPGAPGEGEIAAYLCAALLELDLQVEAPEPEPGRVSVVGRLAGTGGGRSLMLNGHVDTVGVDGMAAPFEPAVRDGRLYARGAYDMKGSLAACLAAVKALQDAGVRLRGDLLMTAVADEEYASLGTADVARRYHADGAIVTEATALDLCLAHKGFSWIEVTVHGRAAHGSRFMDGVDANMRMGRFLATLDELERELRARPPHTLVGPPSLHAATLHGGSGLSTYADRCVLQIERRTVPGESEAGALAEIQALIDRLAAEDPSFHADARVLLMRAPFEVAPDAALARAVGAAAERVRGVAPAAIGQAFWMDSALLAAAGIETVVIGPDGVGAHALEEWVDLESCAALALILAEAACGYCGV